MMNFRPFPIEDVLTISKKELQDMAVKRERKDFNTQSKKVDANLPLTYSISLTYNIRYQSNDVAESDCFSVHVSFVSENFDYFFRCKFGFYVKSANWSAENEKDVIWPSSYCRLKSKLIFSLTDVLNPEKNFLVDGKLFFYVKGMAFIEECMNEKYVEPLTLAKILWNRNDDRDFNIAVGKDGEAKTEIPIHKLILASRSTVFDRMLQTDMKEKSLGKVEIIDFDVKIVQTAIEFFYDQKNYESFTTNELIDLLQFAEKYDIPDLKIEMERFLLHHLYPNTICQIANASIAANSFNLRNMCLQSIIIYLKQGLPFADSETLDRDFVAEMLKKASSPNGL